jgi:hypothetical protein
VLADGSRNCHVTAHENKQNFTASRFLWFKFFYTTSAILGSAVHPLALPSWIWECRCPAPSCTMSAILGSMVYPLASPGWIWEWCCCPSASRHSTSAAICSDFLMSWQLETHRAMCVSNDQECNNINHRCRLNSGNSGGNNSNSNNNNDRGSRRSSSRYLFLSSLLY